MSSTFGGLEMGRSALNAFRLGMQTVGHNISNMNTEGYSRQRVNFATVTPENIPHVGQLGQGMYASDIERIRDEFLDFQFRDCQSALGYWEKVNDLYDSIQNYISEPASSGIRSALDTFFSNIQTLQQKPEDTSTRRSLVESANSLGMMLSNLVSSFNTYNESINMEIQRSVQEANKMLYDIAALNKEIAMSEALDQNANDLRDQRDLILDKLSKMMDISYNEPVEHNGIKGEFFVTLNGRTLVQGIHVRELAAHAFMWDNQVYYDVQVTDNEFDIVDNPDIAEALAVGPEGTYQLAIDRIANGVEWTTGGGNAKCLETYAVKTSEFADGVILSRSTDDTGEEIPRKLSFRTLITKEVAGDDSTGVPVNLTVKIDWDNENNSWNLRAEKDGEQFYTDSYSTANGSDITLTAENLREFITSAIAADADLTNSGLTASIENNTLTFTTGEDRPLEFNDYSGMLGILTEAKRELTDVNMRANPVNIDDALNIAGSFRIQVGSQGTRVTSNNFKANPGKSLEEGNILASGESGESYTFRVSASNEQVDFSVKWNESAGKWVLSSDLGNTKTIDSTNTKGNGVLTVKDLTDFMNETFNIASRSGNTTLQNMSATSAGTSGKDTQFYIESRDNHLISISDVSGNLASVLGIVNKNPVITIDVKSSDSLITIRNKINEKYQEEFGLTEPEQWVHASVDNGYLEISANVAGEAQHITIMGAEDGNMQVLRRLGLTANQQIYSDIKDTNGNYITSYREITYIPDSGVAQDASFSLNGVKYLSSDNKINMARRIPAVSGINRYGASELSMISEGMWLNLKNTGITTIHVEHHVRDGSIKGLEEARDELIPNIKSELDEMAYGLIKTFNAYQYSGYGIAGDVTTTGIAFFNNLGYQAGAAEKLSVTDKINADISLIGAAMGKKDSDGKAVSGVSGGNGDGSNASRMTGLNFSKVLENGTMTIGGIYEAMLSQIGTEAGHAKLMYTTQATVSEQIDSQRQAVSGVNLDEELMNMIILNRAFGAMSRYVTTMDEMLNTIINGFGLVGR